MVKHKLRKKATRWARASLLSQKKRQKQQAKRDANYHKMINTRQSIYY